MKTWPTLLPALLALALLACLPAAPGRAAATAGAGALPDLEPFFDELLARQLAENHLVGAAVAVVQGGETVFAKGYGFADQASLTPVDAGQTLFYIGSAGKLFTWTAVMQLVEAGRLDLDADVNTYLDFALPATFPEPITLHHLMTHTAGFEDELAALLCRPGSVLPLGEFLRRYMPTRVYPPGQFFAYSNYGTALAGYIVERVTGETYEQYLTRHLLEPLGMRRSAAVQPLPPELAGSLSKGYHYRGGRFDALDFEWVCAAPAAAVRGPAEDMARFMLAHLEDGRVGEARILQASTLATMHRQQFAHRPDLLGMAYGFVESGENGRRILWHLGESARFTTLIALLPEEHTGLFVSYNTPFNARQTLSAFLDRYYPPAAAAQTQPEASGWPFSLSRFAGSYVLTRAAHTSEQKLLSWLGAVQVNTNRSGGLDLAGVPYELVAPTLFREVGGERLLTFRVSEDGAHRVTHLCWGPLAYVRVAAWQTPEVQLLALAVCLAALTISAVGWLVAAFVRRGRSAPLRRGEQVARLLAGGLGVWSLGLMAYFLTLMLGYAETYIYPTAQAALVTRLLALALPLAGGVALAALLAWLRRYWSLAGRIHYTLLAAAGLLLVLILLNWNLVG